MQNELSHVLCMKFPFEKLHFLVKIGQLFFLNYSKCINMHHNASECMQNELCKCFVYEIIKDVDFITFKFEVLLVTLCDGRPCTV